MMDGMKVEDRGLKLQTDTEPIRTRRDIQRHHDDWGNFFYCCCYWTGPGCSLCCSHPVIICSTCF